MATKKKKQWDNWVKKNNINNWEKKFDEEFTMDFVKGKRLNRYFDVQGKVANQLKSFIARLLKQQKEKILKEASKVVEIKGRKASKAVGDSDIF